MGYETFAHLDRRSASMSLSIQFPEAAIFLFYNPQTGTSGIDAGTAARKGIMSS